MRAVFQAIWRKLFITYHALQRGVADEMARLYFTKKEFAKGFKEFERTGHTPDSAYQALISLYCSSNGSFNEKVHQKISQSNPPRFSGKVSDGVAGKLQEQDLERINSRLIEDGYYLFDKELSAASCERLIGFALRTPVTQGDTKVLYDPANPISEIYRFDVIDLINNCDIQELIMDQGLIDIARKYLQCEPIFDFPAMWWSTSFSKVASSDAAQLYHFDMDRIKWLKMFFYINEVGPDNGPHCYIRGSHKPGAKPLELLKRGYARIDDPDLQKYYRKEDFISVCASAGSMFAGDTRCWHKGTPLKQGQRLVLELEYTSSMFGVNYPRMLVSESTDKFRQFCKTNTVYASAIHFKD